MRKIYGLILVASLAFVTEVNGQSTANYTFSTNTTGTLTAMTGSTQLIAASTDDGASASAANIGFDFFYMGTRYTTFWVNSNGLLQLGGASMISTSNTQIGSTATTAFISACSFDMQTGSSGKVHYVLTGTAPNRTLVVEWLNMAIGWNASTTDGVFQVQLSEGTGAIALMYGNMVYRYAPGTTTVSAGIQSSNTNNTYATINLNTNAVTTTGGTTNYNLGSTVPTTMQVSSASSSARRTYLFSPSATTTPTNLTFTSVTGTSMNVNWTDNASDEKGYVIYKSTDNVNFTYVTTTAANAGTYAASGLNFGTTYYWKVYALRESLGTALSGSQATSAGSLSGTKTVGTGGDYTNLTNAFAAINTNGLAGNLTLQLITGYPAAVETYPIAVSAVTATGAYSVNVYPTISGLSITSSNATGTLNFNGSANVTFDGRINATGSTKSLTIANTVTTGYAIQLINDATSNTIKYCAINGVNNSTTNGTIVFSTSTGTTGNDNNTIDNCDILDGATTPLNAIYSAGQSTSIDNSGNSVTNCNIANYFGAASASNGIYLASNSASWTITGNKFYQGATRTMTTGNINRAIQINTASGGSYTISSNTIGYANSTGTGTSTYNGSTCRFIGMDITAATSPVSSIQGNTITNISVSSSSGGTVSAPVFGGIIAQSGGFNIGTTSANTIGASTGTGAISVTGTTSGFYVEGINVTTGAATSIQNNIVGSINVAAATTVACNFYGIWGQGAGNITINGNTVGSTSTSNSITVGTDLSNTATSVFYGVRCDGTAAVVVGATSAGNTVQNVSVRTTGAASFYGYYNGSAATSASYAYNTLSNVAYGWTTTSASGSFYGFNNANTISGAYSISNNTFQNITNLNTSGTVYLFYNSNGTNTYSFQNNTINNISRASSLAGDMYIHYNNGGPSSGTATLDGNTITNITSGGSAAVSAFYGLHSSTASSQNVNYTNNTISGISAGTSASYGIYNTYGSTVNISGNNINTFTGANTIYAVLAGSSNTTNCNTFSNTIYSITSTGTNTVAGIVIGASNTSAVNTCYKNKIYTLNSSGASSVCYGIWVSAAGSTSTIYNNLIGDIRATTSSQTAPAPSVAGIYVNTGTTAKLYYNSIYLSATSSGGNFGSAGVYANTTPTLDMRNNIIVNASTPNGTGKAIAYQRTSTTIATYASTSNNNLYYAGTASASHLIYYDGTNSNQNITSFKSQMVTRDQASVSENPPFLSTTGSASTFLHIDPATATQVESGAAAIATFTDDYDGDTRNATTPDIGADEFAGTVADFTAPTITYTALGSGCTGARSLTATITDNSGVPTTGTGLPMLYWKINSGSYTGVQGVSIGSNQYTFTFGSGTVNNDVVSYYIVAQDNVATPNVGAFPSTGAAGFSASPPAASTAPTSPSTYTAYSLGATTYTVGASGTYTTLTSAVAAYNSGCLNGAVVFSLTDASYSGSETFPITINGVGSATNTLTIKPASGVTAAITGSSAVGILKLSGADYVTIDGSNNGTTSRNLSLSNTNSGTSSVVVWVASASASDGATFNTIKNLIVTGNSSTTTFSGIISSSGTTVGAVADAANANNSYTNNLITKTSYGIGLSGVVGNESNNSISNNTIGSATTASKLGYRGIYLSQQQSVSVTGNTILGVNTTTSSTSNASGIYVGGTMSGGVISNNNISDIKQLNTAGYGSNGIDLASGSTATGLTISNNLIYDVASYGYASSVGESDNGYGIVLTSGGGYKIYYNSINLTTNQTIGVSAAINITTGITTASSVDIRDNIFANNQSANTRYSIYCEAANTVFSNINYNDYFNTGTNLGYVNGTQANIAAVRTATGQDVNSVAGDPLFNSSTNLQPQPTSPASATGTPIGTVTTDYAGITRSVTTPSMGAYETTLDLVAPVISYTALTNSCSAGARTLTATITDAGSGVPTTGSGLPVLYYKINSGSYTSSTATSLGSNQYQFSLGTGSVSGDVVSYYIVAQDNATTPNVAAFPSAGASGFTTSPPTASAAPTTPSSYTVLATLTGTYTVGAGGNYTTLTSAVSAYNNGCVTGAVVFSLTGATYSGTETFPITINSTTGASSSNTLTIKPASGVTATISGSNATSLVVLNGANYVTIDGSNSVGGSTQDLTISNTNSSGATVVLQNAASNNTVKNTVVKGLSTSSTGVIYFSTTTGNGCSNNLISASTITGGSTAATATLYGVYFAGTSGTNGDANLISGCTINNFSYAGIYFSNYYSNTSITQNTINEGVTQTSTSLYGIYVDYAPTALTIARNKIYDLKTSGSTPTIRGIYLGNLVSADVVSINNNLIILDGSSTTVGATMYGIDNFSNTGVISNIYFNSIYIGGSSVTGSGTTAGLNQRFSNTTTFKNNIIHNARSNSSGTGKHYGINLSSSYTTSLTSDYNDVYVNGTGGVFGTDGTDRATLSAWQTATSKDSKSLSLNPNYTAVSSGNLLPTAGSYLLGTAIGGIISDYAGTTRSTPADMGAYEGVEAGRWIGGTSTTYGTASNWDNGAVPSGINTTICTNTPNNPALATGTRSVANLNIQTGTTLTVSSGGTLQISGAITNGTANNLVATTGAVEFNGSSVQTIASTTFSGSTVGTLNINNAAGVTLSQALTASTMLKLTAGTFTNGGNLTMANAATIDRNAGTLNSVPTFTTNVHVNYSNSGSVATGNEIPNTTTVLQNLTLAGGGTVNMNKAVTVNGAFALNSGTLAVSTQTLTLNGSVSSSGSLTSSATGTVSYAMASNGQSVLAANYGNLTFSNFNKTLPSSGTVGIAGTFTTGSATGHTITGSTINFNGATQTVPVFTYNNLDLTNATGTAYANGVVGVSGTFTPASITSATQGTINFKGSAQTVPAFNYYNLDLTSATGTLFSSGTIAVVGTFTPASITSANAGTISFNANGAQTIPAFTYNNLSTAIGGTKTLSGGVSIAADINIGSSSTLATANNDIDVKGNWSNSGTFTAGTATVSFTGTGAQSIAQTGSGSFNILTVNKASSTATTSNAITVATKIRLLNGSLNNSTGGITLSNGATIERQAGSLSTAPTFPATLDVMYTNSSDITSDVELPSGSSVIQNLSITGGGNVTLNKTVTVNNTLTLTSGKIQLGSFDMTAALISGGSSSSYAVLNSTGKLKRLSLNGTQLMPVGATTSSYSPVTIANTTGTDWAVQLSASVPTSGTWQYNRDRAIQRTWEITPTATPGATDLSFQYNTGDAGIQGSSYDATASVIINHLNSSTGLWEQAGAQQSQSAGINIISVSGWTTFSPFVIGMAGAPLPVTLLHFSAKKEDRVNKLSWTTATEMNNSGFQVERSIDGLHFSSIGFVATQAAGGNSTSDLNYNFTDMTPGGVKQYYLLKQIDIDGHYKYSAIVVLSSDKIDAVRFTVAYPNPVQTTLNLVIEAPQKGNINLVVTDMNSKAVRTRSVGVEAGSSNIAVDFSGLPAGNYLLKAISADGTVSETQKVVKQ